LSNQRQPAEQIQAQQRQLNEIQKQRHQQYEEQQINRLKEQLKPYKQFALEMIVEPKFKSDEALISIDKLKEQLKEAEKIFVEL
jgi:hypothetical protein